MTAIFFQVVCRIVSPLHYLLHVSGVASGLMALRGCESLRWHVGRLGMWIRYYSAHRSVPGNSPVA